MAMSKSQHARMIAAGLVHESFQHQTLGHFNVTLLRERIKTNPPELRVYRFDECRVADDPSADPLAYIVSQREVDPERCAELTEAQLQEPLIYLCCPPGSNGPMETHLLVDGIHRLVARHARGYTDFSFYMLPLEQAPRVAQDWVDLPWGEREMGPSGLIPRP